MKALDAQDALTAAPEHHRLIHENDQVRVIETRIMPGEVTAAHTHIWPAVVTVLSPTDILRRDGEGKITLDSREWERKMEPHETFWQEPLPLHTLENVGNQPLLVVAVEIKG